MRTPLSLLALAALAATQVAATDCGQITRDPGFDLWCGDELCSWKVVRGGVRRVATWHDGDAGVELVGPDAAISQLTPVDSHDGTCIRFDLIANVAEGAEAHLGIDVFGDGSIDHVERIPTSRWKPVSFRLRVARPYRGIRFELSKRGAGTAVLAQMHAELANDCEGLSEISGGPAPNGAFCSLDADCGSGLCRLVEEPGAWLGVAYLCVGCDPDAATPTCGAGEVCGRAEPTSPVRSVPIECVAEGGDPLGAQCRTDGECASGVCTAGACSTCGSGYACGAGEACGLAWEYGPWVCNPGGRARAAGEPCATDDDCASRACAGAVRGACTDGRPCASPANCPVEDGLAPGACTTVGFEGGTCQ